MKIKLPFQKKSDDQVKNVEIPDIVETFHKMDLEELEKKFSTSVQNGLEGKKAKDLLAVNGPNKIKQKKESKLKKIAGYLLSGFGSLFLFASVLCILAWQPLGSMGGQTPDKVNLALGIMLILVVLIQGGFNAFQDWSSQKVMNSIKNMMPSNAYVFRNGTEVTNRFCFTLKHMAK